MKLAWTYRQGEILPFQCVDQVTTRLVASMGRHELIHTSHTTFDFAAKLDRRVRVVSFDTTKVSLPPIRDTALYWRNDGYALSRSLDGKTFFCSPGVGHGSVLRRGS